MTRNELIATAERLRVVSTGALTEFTAKRDALAAAVNGQMGQRSDLVKLVGQDGRTMSEDNNRNFSLFMESIFSGFQPEVLVDTVLWVFRTYRSHGFSPIYWPANLDCWRRQLQQQLASESFSEVVPYYDWLITNIPSFTLLTDKTTPEPPTPPPSHHP